MSSEEFGFHPRGTLPSAPPMGNTWSQRAVVAGLCERTEAVPSSGQKVALRANNGQYVCAEDGGGGEVVANCDALGAWGTFTINTRRGRIWRCGFARPLETPGAFVVTAVDAPDLLSMSSKFEEVNLTAPPPIPPRDLDREENPVDPNAGVTCQAEVQASEEMPEDDPEGDENPSGGQQTGPRGERPLRGLRTAFRG
jgi:hypothetical protein